MSTARKLLTQSAETGFDMLVLKGEVFYLVPEGKMHDMIERLLVAKEAELRYETRREMDAQALADLHAVVARQHADADRDEDEGVRRIVAREADEPAFPMAVYDRIDAGESAVKVLREHRNLTQAELAQRANIAQPYVSRLERKQAAGSVSTLRAIAKVLDVPLELVLGEERADARAAKGEALRAHLKGALE